METRHERVIIADTSELVSLFSIDDRNHTEAVRLRIPARLERYFTVTLLG